jgi:parallel beta-helix repeat protein
MVPRMNSKTAFISFCFSLAIWTPQLTGATLCVNTSGSGGCFSKIGDAVLHAGLNDTIKVAAGTYKEDVVIGKPVALVGAGESSTVIDATGLPNGIYIDGLDNAGLSDVLVRDFTIKNANFEGILITNSSGITISDNNVLNNDRSLSVSTGTCPGQPAFETNEDFDCGEGIHLSGVDHSMISKNLVANNSGGILISDDTGATHDNLISENIVKDNPYDCGITLASHVPLAGSPYGVFHNTVFANESSRNGLGAPGAGAGVGIFASAPGTASYGNVVVSNVLKGNGLPGVTMHSHTPGQNLNDNMIVGNTISGNAADTDDSATAGPTGINVFGVSTVTGTLIAHNVIEHESIDVSVNTPGEVRLHSNALLGREIGVDNIGAGSVDATDNWWGCWAGPVARACSNVGGPGVLFTPWLTDPF